MSKLRLTLSALALLLAFPSIRAQAVETKPGTATVSGRALLKGEPAQGVAIVLQPQASGRPANQDAVLRARIDGDDRFQFTEVASGRFAPLIASAQTGVITSRIVTYSSIPGVVMQGQKITLCFPALLFAFLPGYPIFAQSSRAGATTPGTAMISGRVMMKGEPARNILIYLQSQQGPAPSNPEAILHARTDEGGQFRITGVPSGAYRVVPLAPGFTSTYSSQPGFQGKTFNLSEGESIENVEIELKPGGVITGRVTDSQGRPLVEERVTLSRLDQSGRAQPNLYYGPNFEMLQTDDRGVYRIYGLPEGRYLVSVGIQQTVGSATGGSSRNFYPRTFHPDTANESEAKIIEITEGSENTNIDITVSESKQTRTVSGRVVDAATGQTVAGVEITWDVMYPNTRGISYSGWNGDKSRANGEFHLKGLTPGKFEIYARGSDDSEFFSEPVTCDLSEGDLSGVEIRVRQGGSISGSVVIEGTYDPKALNLPALYLSVNVSSPKQAGVFRISNPKINANGGFRIGGLPPGIVNIQYYPRPEHRGLSLARIEHNGATVNEGIKVGAGDQLTGVRVVMTFGTVTLRGEVKIIGGALLPRQMLFANARRTGQSPKTSSTFGAEVDARGQFVIERLIPGEYEVTIGPLQYYGSDPVDQRIANAFLSVREKVIVNRDTQHVALVVDLSQKEGNK